MDAIDFRELVKDLAAIFHTRIELRQIGVRDEAKLLGGIGCCGRTALLCDFSWRFLNQCLYAWLKTKVYH